MFLCVSVIVGTLLGTSLVVFLMACVFCWFLLLIGVQDPMEAAMAAWFFSVFLGAPSLLLYLDRRFGILDD